MAPTWHQRGHFEQYFQNVPILNIKFQKWAILTQNSRVQVIFIKIRQLRSHRPLHYLRHHHPFPLIPMNTLHQLLDFQPTSQINTIRQFQPLPLLPLLASALLQCLGPLVFAIVSTIVKVVSVCSYKCSRFF